ncbi:MAG: hypothetical protein WC443_08920 [Desulfobaccales bacterium]
MRKFEQAGFLRAVSSLCMLSLRHTAWQEAPGTPGSIAYFSHAGPRSFEELEFEKLDKYGGSAFLNSEP